MSTPAAADPRPVLFVTGQAPPSRLRPFAALHDREGAVFALFGGRAKHALGGEEALPFPHLRPEQRAVHALAASGRFRAVVCGTGGRVALPAAYTGARRAGVPFVLWASLWAHPRTPAHLAAYPAVRRLYRRADAVATYGPHVSAYVRARGARRVHEAPQAVDNAFWATQGRGARETAFQALFVGRLEREKGAGLLLSAWRAAALAPAQATLTLVGEGPVAVSAEVRGVRAVGRRPAPEVRNFYAAADVLVVPSLATRTFREPWGLVVNEAMNQSLPVIASNAVGAAAGGLVRHGGNGLVVPAGDARALAGALRELAADPALRARMGAAGRRDVRAYTPEAWAAGMSRALADTGASRGGPA